MKSKTAITRLPIMIENTPTLISSKPNFRPVHIDLLFPRAFAPNQRNIVFSVLRIIGQLQDKSPTDSQLIVFDHSSDLLFREMDLLNFFLYFHVVLLPFLSFFVMEESMFATRYSYGTSK